MGRSEAFSHNLLIELIYQFVYQQKSNIKNKLKYILVGGRAGNAPSTYAREYLDKTKSFLHVLTSP